MNPILRRRGLFGPRGFNSLFGAFGTWLDVNNLSLLYTTYNGSVNVAVVDDPIGRVERKAGTLTALNATSTQRPLLKQWPNSGRYYAYHDRVDDKLTLASLAMGVYTIGTATFAGVQIYEHVHNITGTLNIPGADYTECLIIKRSLNIAEYTELQAYLLSKCPVIDATDVFRLYSATNSVNLSITEEGGSSGATWELGDGQTASGTSCVKTITAPQSVILRATDKTKIQQINWSSKSLYGQLPAMNLLTSLTTFYCYVNQLTGSIPSLTANTALTNFQCHLNQLTGSIPSLTANTLLTTFVCYSNQLTGAIPSLTANTVLNTFQCHSNQLTGSIPSLTANTALTNFQCHLNQLTGSIPSLTANTLLTNFACSSNQLIGSIPSLTANTALTTFVCSSNQLIGSIPSLTANTALTTFVCYVNQLTGSIPSLTANTALTNFQCHLNQLTGSIPSLTANTLLTTFVCYSNQLTDFGGGAVSGTLGDFQAQNNLLTVTAVNDILAAFVAANRTTGTRVLNLGGTGNAAPTGQGLTDKATLVSRGWTVTTN